MVWCDPIVDRFGSSEHRHNDAFQGLVERTRSRYKARNRLNAVLKPGRAYGSTWGGARGGKTRRGGRTRRRVAAPVAVRDLSPEPYFRAEIIEANVWCEGGTVLHFIDKILFPDDLNEQDDYEEDSDLDFQ